MAYGERSGRRAGGEYSAFDKIGMGLAAAIGIAVATAVDLVQSDETSALFVFNKWVSKLTDTLGVGGVPLYGVVLLLMLIGALSILYFQPITFRGAFVQGFGVLAAIMTVAPSDLGAPLPGSGEGVATTERFEALPEGQDVEDAFGDEINYRPGRNGASLYPVAAVIQPEQVGGYTIRMKIVFPEGLEEDMASMIRKGHLRGRLHDETTGRTYNLFRNSGADLVYRNNTIYIVTRLPDVDPQNDREETTLAARVEAAGYKITEERFSAREGVNPIWEIQMTPGGAPLMLQRLQRPYRY